MSERKLSPYGRGTGVRWQRFKSIASLDSPASRPLAADDVFVQNYTLKFLRSDRRRNYYLRAIAGRGPLHLA